MKWLWIDPGETCGWAEGTVTEAVTRYAADDSWTDRPKLTVDRYGQDKSRTFLLKLLATAGRFDVVGYERYEIRADKWHAHVGSSVPTLQVIGGIRLACWHGQDVNQAPWPQIETLQPRDKTTGIASAAVHLPDYVAIMRDALDRPHDEGHYGDALMLAVAWFHKNYAAHV
jgi:hypothetical protein